MRLRSAKIRVAVFWTGLVLSATFLVWPAWADEVVELDLGEGPDPRMTREVDHLLETDRAHRLLRDLVLSGAEVRDYRPLHDRGKLSRDGVKAVATEVVKKILTSYDGQFRPAGLGGIEEVAGVMKALKHAAPILDAVEAGILVVRTARSLESSLRPACMSPLEFLVGDDERIRELSEKICDGDDLCRRCVVSSARGINRQAERLDKVVRKGEEIGWTYKFGTTWGDITSILGIPGTSGSVAVISGALGKAAWESEKQSVRETFWSVVGVFNRKLGEVIRQLDLETYRYATCSRDLAVRRKGIRWYLLKRKPLFRSMLTCYRDYPARRFNIKRGEVK